MPRRTLVVHTGGIGDFILTCPALSALAASGPLELAGTKERVHLAVVAGIAESAHDLDAIAFDSIFSKPKSRLIEFLRRFDRAIVWMRDDGAIACALRDLGVPDVRIFPGLPPENWTRHASGYFAECLDIVPAPITLAVPPAASPTDVIIHPGSGAARKNWPIDRYFELARTMGERGWGVQWCSGPAEHDAPLPKEANLLPHQTLSDLASILAAAKLYIGNDSGITHLAAAVGCPTIAIFGPTNPEVWAPRGNHVRVVQGEPWPAIGGVLEAAQALRAIR